MKFNKRLGLMIVVFALCVGVDQFTKAIAKTTLSMDSVREYLGGSIKLLLTHNTGTFLGLGGTLPANLRYSLMIVGIGVFLLALLLYTLLNKRADAVTVASLTMVFSGGISNLLDRIIYGGYVVDFMNVSAGSLHTGVFNVADMVLLVGAIMLFMVGFKTKQQIAHG
ncbi:lipoprotein signal peptidase [Rouxiella silvae]|uniref:Lipoprotein signal peptidase n=1 Tax=Rouxiella silvae TaxID=1646373 RepID=A0AA40X0U4_9GAMM|nr:signal peptidase II [Rouxiella silvae]MBF6636695.1 signal peptidase II [Rouxiella silvae]ORJ18811.1 lipoprotein signal peptidase [Rouxiella silvae]